MNREYRITPFGIGENQVECADKFGGLGWRCGGEESGLDGPDTRP